LAILPPKATGSIEFYPWKDGRTTSVYARVRAHGGRHRVDFGTNHEGWTVVDGEDGKPRCPRAEVELEKILGEVERGTWKPPGAGEDQPVDAITVHFTLSRHMARKKTEGLDDDTLDRIRREIDRLLTFRPRTLTAEIDSTWVDDLKLHLAKQKNKNNPKKTIAASTVNKTLDTLAEALDYEVDAKVLDANPARGKRRRMAEPKKRRNILEPDMVVDLLQVAGEWESEIPQANKRFGRRAFLLLLCTAGGPRITEATDADRGHFDLTADAWRIPDSKTEAGERYVELPAATGDELREHAANMVLTGRSTRAGHPMFATATGNRHSNNNIRRVLREVVKRTNKKREAEGKILLPDRVTPHTLRRTFVQMAVFAGRDLRWIMDQVGHHDPTMTLKVYAQAHSRKSVDRDLVWRLMRMAVEPEQNPAIGPRNGPTADSAMSDRPARMHR
jgi:integrase